MRDSLRPQIRVFKRMLATATASSALLLGACTSDAGFTPGVASLPPPPSGTGAAGGFDGPAAGVSIGGNAVTGSSGASTLVGVNVLPGGTSTGTLATVDVLAGDGGLVNVAVPTTAAGIEAALNPVSGLVDTLVGPQVAAKVDGVVEQVAPGVAAVTSVVDGVTTPVLGTLNGALAPVTGQLLGSLSVAPVSDLAGGVLGNLPGLDGGTANFEGQILGANIGPLATGFDGEGTGPVIAANLLQQGDAAPTPLTGQIATVNALGNGTVVAVDLATTPEAVAQGLRPVANLTGALLGAPVGGLVGEVTDNAAPAVAAVTSVLDSTLGQVTGGLNAAAGDQLGGGAGLLQPILGTLVEGVGAGGLPGGAGNPLAPVTNLILNSGDSPLGSLTNVLASGDGAPPLALPSGLGGVIGSAVIAPLAEFLGPQETATVIAPVVALLNGQGIEGVTVPLTSVLEGNGAASLVSPVQSITQRLTGGLVAGEGAGNLIGPVQGLLEGVTEGLLGGLGDGNLLGANPAAGLLPGILPGGDAGNGAVAVSGLLEGVTGGLLGGEGGGGPASLLDPVKELLGGLTRRLQSGNAGN